MRGLRRLFRILFIERRSLTILTALFFVALFVALSNGFWLMSRLANVILIVIPLAYIWTRFNLNHLEVTVERPVDRLQEGADFSERITVVNTGWFTKLWLEVEDPSDLPGHNARRVISLGPKQRRTWRIVSHCERRGRYSMGPVQITSGDLFGMFRRTKTFGQSQYVLVYPRAIDLPNFSVPPALLPGEGRFKRASHLITPNAAGVRDYQPGDSFNRIHWRTTARTGNLAVKLFELDPASDIWVVLDLEGAVQSGEGDDSTEEHGVRIAASIARFFLLANRSVGFMAYGSTFHVQEAQRGLSQYTRILEHLALANATGDVSLADLLNHESPRFGRHTTLVVITPSTDETWVVSMQVLAGRGVKLASVLLEPSTFGGEESALLIFGSLTAADISTYMVKRTDNLALTLGSESSVTATTGGGR